MSELSDLDIKQDAAVLERWITEPSYRIFQRELEAMKEADAMQSVMSPWHAQIAGLRANALDELTRMLRGIIERKNQIVSAEIEARESGKSSPALDHVPPRQSPQAT